MPALIKSQVEDALLYMSLFDGLADKLSDNPNWGDGLHLILPAVIPLRGDYRSDETVYAWLVANDFDGYDLATEDPTPKETTP